MLIIEYIGIRNPTIIEGIYGFMVQRQRNKFSECHIFSVNGSRLNKKCSRIGGLYLKLRKALSLDLTAHYPTYIFL